jgi:hypothetical protein
VCRGLERRVIGQQLAGGIPLATHQHLVGAGIQVHPPAVGTHEFTLQLHLQGLQIEQQLGAVTAERDSLRSRLGAARARIDALLERLPARAKDTVTKESPP